MEETMKNKGFTLYIRGVPIATFTNLRRPDRADVFIAERIGEARKKDIFDPVMSEKSGWGKNFQK